MLKVISEIAEEFGNANENTGRKLFFSFHDKYNLGEGEIRDEHGDIESSIILASDKELYNWIDSHIATV